MDIARLQENRRWLVESRNSIQRLMLELSERYSEDGSRGTSSAAFQLATGAAFSLWRAVFLLLAEEQARRTDDRVGTVKAVLEQDN